MSLYSRLLTHNKQFSVWACRKASSVRWLVAPESLRTTNSVLRVTDNELAVVVIVGDVTFSPHNHPDWLTPLSAVQKFGKINPDPGVIFAFCVEQLTSSQHFENCFFKQIICTNKKTRLLPEGLPQNEDVTLASPINTASMWTCCSAVWGSLDFSHTLFFPPLAARLRVLKPSQWTSCRCGAAVTSAPIGARHQHRSSVNRTDNGGRGRTRGRISPNLQKPSCF